MQPKTLNLGYDTEQHENIAVRLLFPRTESSSNVHKNRPIQSAAGITQVNSVSGWISAGLGQRARHKGGIEISSVVLIYSLPVLSLLLTTSACSSRMHKFASPLALVGAPFEKAQQEEDEWKSGRKKSADMREAGNDKAAALTCTCGVWWMTGIMTDDIWEASGRTPEWVFSTHKHTQPCDLDVVSAVIKCQTGLITALSVYQSR